MDCIALTETLVLDPIRSIRGVYAANQMQKDCCDFFEGEVVTRVLAATTPIFALLEAGLCLFFGYIGVCVGIIDLCCYCKFDDFVIAGIFLVRSLAVLVMAVAGPILGIINPDFLEDLRAIFLPPWLSLNIGSSSSYGGTLNSHNVLVQDPDWDPDDELSRTSSGDARVLPSVGELQTIFNGDDLREKHRAVQTLESAGKASYVARQAIADAVYRSISNSSDSSLGARQVKWLTDEEIDEERLKSGESSSDAGSIRPPAFQCGYPSLFHATSTLKNLKRILRTRRVEVRHQGAYPGAFVSTRPEILYGHFILAFKQRKIERLSPPMSVSQVSPEYWVGCSRNIPVTKKTLVCVIFVPPIPREESDSDRDEGMIEPDGSYLERKCRNWAGFDVPVISFRDARSHIDAVRRFCGALVPNEWPTEYLSP